MHNSQNARGDVPLYMTVQEVAARLGLNVKTIYAAINSGTMPSIRVGRTVRIPAAVFRSMDEERRG